MHGGHNHHAHGHAGHIGDVETDHAHPPAPTSERILATAALITLGFMVAEITGGIISGSLALLSDAAHMATDAAALVLAWVAARMAQRPADSARSYGFGRMQVLVAFVNGLALFLIAGWIVWEAAQRLMAPAPVDGALVIWLGAAGLLVNALVFWLLSRGDRDNINMRGAMLHVLGDLLGSVAAIVAGLVIARTGWTPIDPILSVFVALLVLRSAGAIVAQSAHILLEGAPASVDIARVADELAKLPGVANAHHIHLWSITEGSHMATLHIRLAPGAEAQADAVRNAVKARLAAAFGITHATVELETGDPAGHDDGLACPARPAA